MENDSKKQGTFSERHATYVWITNTVIFYLGYIQIYTSQSVCHFLYVRIRTSFSIRPYLCVHICTSFHSPFFIYVLFYPERSDQEGGGRREYTPNLVFFSKYNTFFLSEKLLGLIHTKTEFTNPACGKRLRAPPPTQKSISGSCGPFELKFFLWIETNLT